MSIKRISARMGSERGFTLVELLVVMLILGVLAAIAIPAFFNQRDKASDAEVKSGLRTAQTAQETNHVDKGTYTAVAADLTAIEPTLSELSTFTATTPTGGGYTVSAKSDSGVTYTLTKSATGVTTRTCTPNKGGCVAGSW